MSKAWLPDPARPSLGAPLPPGSVRPLPIPGDHSLRAGVGRWTPRAPGAGRGRAGNIKGTGGGRGRPGKPKGPGVLTYMLAVNRYPNSLLFLNPLLKGDLEIENPKKNAPKSSNCDPIFPAQCKNRARPPSAMDPINRGKLWSFFHFGFPRGLGEPSFFCPPLKVTPVPTPLIKVTPVPTLLKAIRKVTCLSGRLPVSLSVHLSARLSVSLSVCLSVCLSVRLSVCPPVCPCVCRPLRRFVRQFVGVPGGNAREKHSENAGF